MWFSDLLTQFAIECLRYTFLWVWLYGMLFAHYFFFWFWWLALARSYAAPGSPDSSVFLSQLQSLHFSCWCFSTVIKHGLFLPRTSWLCTPLSICPCTPQSLPGSAVFLITPALDCSIFSSCGFFFFSSESTGRYAPFSINTDGGWMTLVWVLKDVNTMGVMGLLVCPHPLSFVSVLKHGLLYPRLAST